MRGLILFTVFMIVVTLFYSKAARAILRRSAEAIVPSDKAGRRRGLPFDVAEIGILSKWLIIGVIIGLIVVISLSVCWVEVGPAETLAVYDPLHGGILPMDYPEGWHLLAPWTTRNPFSKRLQEYTMSIVSGEGAVLGDDSMVCQTSEGLSIKVDATAVFRIPSQGANRLWKTVGPDYVGIIVRPAVRNVVRMVVAKYGIMEVYSNAAVDQSGQPGVDFYVGRRKEIEDEIAGILKKQFTDKGLELVMFLFRNVAYDSPQFERSIVEKQVAQQSVTTQQYLAEAAKIRSQARIVRAEGEAKAIQMKAEALRIDPRVVSLEWVEQLNPDEVVIFPKGGIVPFIQLPSASGQK